MGHHSLLLVFHTPCVAATNTACGHRVLHKRQNTGCEFHCGGVVQLDLVEAPVFLQLHKPRFLRRMRANTTVMHARHVQVQRVEGRLGGDCH